MQNFENRFRTKGYWMEKIQFDLCTHINSYIEETSINQTLFAERLGVSKGYISQVLSGRMNLSIDKMIGLALAIGVVPDIKFKSIEQYVDEQNIKNIDREKRSQRNRTEDLRQQ